MNSSGSPLARFGDKDMEVRAGFVMESPSNTTVHLLIEWLAVLLFDKESANVNNTIYIVIFTLLLYRDGSRGIDLNTRMKNFSGEMNTLRFVLKLYNAGRRIKIVNNVSQVYNLSSI